LMMAMESPGTYAASISWGICLSKSAVRVLQWASLDLADG